MEDNFNKHLGNKLKLRRLALGLTQTKVAKAINVTFQQIQKYEIGSNRIAASRLFELSNILDVPTSYFFEGLDDDANAPKDSAMDIVSAVASIKDEQMKARIVTFIQDVAGTTVARRA